MPTSTIPYDVGVSASTPVPWTGNPFVLCWLDLLLFFECSWSLIGILVPFTQWRCGELDELYPSVPNLICLALHGFLIIWQLVFLCSLPLLVAFPLGTVILYVIAVMAVNFSVCWVLNGSDVFHKSNVDLEGEHLRHEGECWVYLNGVSIGKHWLRGNLNRLALTFRRPIIGVHNRTYGIIFDLIQCIIERNFCYQTLDIRNSYSLIKRCLLAENHRKVVLILHSQGGIEGSLILNWLLSELSSDVLHKVEIYTFGSAANHFNNPHRQSAQLQGTQNLATPSQSEKVVRHIEHYAADGDFVARWGVLNFNRLRDRYMGRVFIRSGMGHLLNQHYLNTMFPLGKDRRVLERNSFMDSDVEFTSEGAAERARDSVFQTVLNNGNGALGVIVEDVCKPVESPPRIDAEDKVIMNKNQVKSKVKDFSRLWEYRNGGSPTLF